MPNHTHRYAKGERVAVPAPMSARDVHNVADRDYFGIVKQVRFNDGQPRGSHSVDILCAIPGGGTGGEITLFEGEITPTKARTSCMCQYCMTHD
jgi:hypothetical protein